MLTPGRLAVDSECRIMTAPSLFGRSRLWLALLGLGLCLGCSDSGATDVEVTVRRVTIDPSSHAPVVLLEDRAHTVALPIWIGPAEAQAIAMRLEGVAAPRPMTHDLMKDVLEQLGVDLQKVVISELREDTYRARLFLRSKSREIEVDSRPSDAIALALRFGRPIFVAPALLQRDRVIALRGADVQSLTIGGVTVQILSPDLAEHFHLPPGGGVLVSDVADRGGSVASRGRHFGGGRASRARRERLPERDARTGGKRRPLRPARGRPHPRRHWSSPCRLACFRPSISRFFILLLRLS